MKKIIYNVSDEIVKNIINKATSAACEKLDAVFPGYENSGITTNFAGDLEKSIKKLLVEHELIKDI